MKRILIIGSSLAAYSGEGSWIQYLKNLTNYSVDNLSITGISNYMIYDILKKHNDYNYDYFVLFPTPHTRIPLVNGYPELCSYFPDEPSLKSFWNAFWKINNTDTSTPKNYEAALRGYLRYFTDDEFARWITKNVIRDIEDLVPNDRIIWVNGSLDRVMFDSIKSGIKSVGSFSEIVSMESKCFSFNKKNINWNEQDLRKNHMSKVNQKIFANWLLKIIDTPFDELTENDLNLFRVKWITDPNILAPSFAGEY